MGGWTASLVLCASAMTERPRARFHLRPRAAVADPLPNPQDPREATTQTFSTRAPRPLEPATLMDTTQTGAARRDVRPALRGPGQHRLSWRGGTTPDAAGVHGRHPARGDLRGPHGARPAHPGARHLPLHGRMPSRADDLGRSRAGALPHVPRDPAWAGSAPMLDMPLRRGHEPAAPLRWHVDRLRRVAADLRPMPRREDARLARGDPRPADGLLEWCPAAPGLPRLP